jgi:hypothetical protein
VPRLELEHAQAEAVVDRVDHYPEYPDHPHPMVVLKGVLEDMGIAGRIGADTDGYPWILGYQGPTLSELTGTQAVRVSKFVEAQIAVRVPPSWPSSARAQNGATWPIGCCNGTLGSARRRRR